LSEPFEFLFELLVQQSVCEACHQHREYSHKNVAHLPICVFEKKEDILYFIF